MVFFGDVFFFSAVTLRCDFDGVSRELLLLGDARLRRGLRGDVKGDFFFFTSFLGDLRALEKLIPRRDSRTDGLRARRGRAELIFLPCSLSLWVLFQNVLANSQIELQLIDNTTATADPARHFPGFWRCLVSCISLTLYVQVTKSVFG